MAIVKLANTGKGGAVNTTVTTDAIDTTGASLIVVGVHWFDFGEAPSLTDSASNSWTGLNTGGAASSPQTKIYYKAAPTTSASHTFTASSTGGSYPTLTVLVLSGTASSPFDQQSTGSATSTTVQPGSVTPTEDNEIVIVIYSNNQTGGMTVNGGFTESNDVEASGGAHVGGMMAYLIQTTAAAANPTGTVGSSEALAASSATFKSGLLALSQTARDNLNAILVF